MNKNAITVINDLDEGIFGDRIKRSHFYQNVMLPILNEKILQKKSLLDPTRTYIVMLLDPFFSNIDPLKIYTWWVIKTTRNYESKFWDIGEEVKFAFINQFIRMLNTYIKYPDNPKGMNEFIDYLSGLDDFFKNSLYGNMANVHISYLEWYEIRIGDITPVHPRWVNTCKQNINDFVSAFKKTLDKPIILFPLSHVPNIRKFTSLFASPIIPFITFDVVTHTNLEHPCLQIFHDIKVHGLSKLTTYLQIDNNLESFIKIFSLRQIMLQNIYNANNVNVDVVFFNLFHEFVFPFIVHLHPDLKTTLINNNIHIDDVLFRDVVYMLKYFKNHNSVYAPPDPRENVIEGLIDLCENTKNCTLLINKEIQANEFIATYDIIINALTLLFPYVNEHKDEYKDEQLGTNIQKGSNYARYIENKTKYSQL